MDTPGQIFAGHRARLFGIAYRMLGSRADAEDILQEESIRWIESSTPEPRSSLAWLATIVRRAHGSTKRKRANHKQRDGQNEKRFDLELPQRKRMSRACLAALRAFAVNCFERAQALVLALVAGGLRTVNSRDNSNLRDSTNDVLAILSS
jgi:DNA-directed RNA polymerase specialized sigma24 family protein